MTLRRFFLDYLWPLDAYSVSRTVAGKRRHPMEKRENGQIEEIDGASQGIQSATSAKGVRLNLQIQLRSDIRVYARRWFVLSLVLFAMAWASSFILTVLGCLAGAVGFALLGARHYMEEDRAAADAEGLGKTQSRPE